MFRSTDRLAWDGVYTLKESNVSRSLQIQISWCDSVPDICWQWIIQARPKMIRELHAYTFKKISCYKKISFADFYSASLLFELWIHTKTWIFSESKWIFMCVPCPTGPLSLYSTFTLQYKWG